MSHSCILRNASDCQSSKAARAPSGFSSKRASTHQWARVPGLNNSATITQPGMHESSMVMRDCRCQSSSLPVSPSAARRILSSAASSEKAKLLRTLDPFKRLSADCMSALLLAGREEDIANGETVQVIGRPANGLTLVIEGTTSTVKAGGFLGLQELLLGQKCRMTVKAVGAVKLWTVARTDFNLLVQQYPDLGLALYQEMSRNLDSALQEDELKRHALQPFLVAAPKSGVIGKSKYAQRLRKQIVEAARNRKPVLFFGEPGIEKVNYAALVHFGSGQRTEQMALVDCSRLDRHAAEVFGRGSKKGILELIGRGTLLLSNVHQAPSEVLQKVEELLTTGKYERWNREGAGSESELLTSQARIMLTSEQHVRGLDSLVSEIKIAPLRVRPGDIADLQQYFARLISRRRGQPQIALTAEAIRHLESYTFPNNIQELEAMMERAAAQAVVSAGRVPEDVFWFATQARDRFRWNLLTAFPLLKKTLRSQLWPELLNFRFTKYVYPVFVALLLFGPQDRAHNFGLTLFWAYWWPGIFIVYLFLGRVWCAVCPFMIFGELTQRWQISRGVVLHKWPHASVDAWGGWFLFGLFAAILMWEEVWDLPNSAALSGWLLLLITAGAVICSAIFERRLWCRHLCPIGGMNGLFAKMSMTELRARQGVCSSNCKTFHCYKGGPAEPPEGLQTNGCPLASHPAQLVSNANCVLCMDCLKACPHGSIELRVRPPLADIWTGHKPRAAELSLLFMLLGAVYLHHLPELCSQFGLEVATVEARFPHLAASALVLSVPGFFAWVVDAASINLAEFAEPGARLSRRPFVETGYAYLPLVWGGTLAHYLRPFLSEAGRILQVAAATVGAEEAKNTLPALVADDAVIAFLQGTTLLIGMLSSLVLLRKLKARPWRFFVPQVLLVGCFSTELWHLMLR